MNILGSVAHAEIPLMGSVAKLQLPFFKYPDEKQKKKYQLSTEESEKLEKRN